MRANHIIAATFYTDAASISEYRYQRYVSPIVYALGEQYFAVSKTKPKHDVAGEWLRHTDQFWAAKANTVLWYCEQA